MQKYLVPLKILTTIQVTWDFVDHIALAVKKFNIFKQLVINFGQTGVHIVPVSNKSPISTIFSSDSTTVFATILSSEILVNCNIEIKAASSTLSCWYFSLIFYRFCAISWYFLFQATKIPALLNPCWIQWKSIDLCAVINQLSKWIYKSMDNN